MRILLISAYVPFPGDAGSPRIHRLAHELAESHDVSLLVIQGGDPLPGDERRYSGDDSPFVDVMKIEARLCRCSTWRKLENALRLNPWFATNAKYKREHRRVVQNVRSVAESYDAVWIDGLFMLQYAEGCGRPIIIDPRDYKSRLDLAKTAYMPSPLRRTFESLRASLVRRYEKRHLAQVEGVVLNSRVDAAVMAETIGVTATVIGNGCDTSFFHPCPTRGGLPGSPALVFVGNFTYRPNYDAGEFMLREIFPEMRSAFSEAEVYLVGPVPEKGFGPLADGCHVLGYVEDVREYYCGADVFICPLRLGVGVKNKVLEAAAMECAIVASPTSMEGLDFEDGVHLLMAGNPREYVEKVRLAVENGGECGCRLGLNARSLVDQRYSWAECGGQLEHLLLSVTSRRS